MPKTLTTPERLFKRRWRPSQPFRPRRGRLRRWGMLAVFFLLVALIGAYWYITDPKRVRALAETYLSKVLGGPVEVEKAKLSIFEGLRLDGVKVRVDQSPSPDAVVFSAQTFIVTYDLRSILAGRLEGTQIVAIDPHVRLCENLDTRTWNYQRLVREATSRPTTPSDRPIALPEIVLRNAQIEYNEIRNGQFTSVGSMAIEGQLTPLKDDQYAFNLQSRGGMEGVGPAVSGSVAMGTGHIEAQLRNFQFGRDIRLMLPAEVRDWWEQHQLSGRVDIPQLSYTPGRRPGEKAHFKVETELNGVTLAVHPREWMGQADRHRLEAFRGGVALVRALGLNAGGMVDHVAQMLEPTPVKLEKVSGAFVFTDAGIEIKDLTGRFETNGFRIQAKIDGYSPDAAATIKLSSLETENIYIPRAPRFLTWMPGDVKEMYDRIRPEGTCAIALELKRPTAGAPPECTGEVRIVDGNFAIEEFPYPMAHANGRIVFARDPETGQMGLQVVGMQARGTRGGPNENSTIRVDGKVGPFGIGTGVNMHVEGQNISYEPALRAAFPPDVAQAMSIFGPPNLAELLKNKDPAAFDPNWPKYHGRFACDIIRPVGVRTKWTINVDLWMDHATGALKAFPYPMDDMTCELHVRTDHIEIAKAQLKRGGATLEMDGRVSFGSPAAPDLNVRARNVPIDQALLDALPADQRTWILKTGLRGNLDIDGRVYLASPKAAGAEPGIDFDFVVGLKNGRIWPTNGQYAVSDLTGQMKLKPTWLKLENVKGKRGQADVAADGTVAWPDNRPTVDLSGTLSNLALDKTLYAMLPASAQAGWDQVQPEGTLDAEIRYAGEAGVDQPTTAPTTAPASPGPTSRPMALELTLHPRKLAATPKTLPYRMEDVRGTVHITPDQVELKDITARHGDTALSLAGTGTMGERSAWKLQLKAQDVTVDDPFKRAVPPALASMMDAMKVRGKVGLEFSRLDFRPGECATGTDADLAGRVTFNSTGFSVGVPLTDTVGAMDIAAVVRNGGLSELAGKIKVNSMNLAGRAVKNFQAEMDKPADRDLLRLEKMQAQLAGGELAGDLMLQFPERGPSHYRAGLVLHGADARQLLGDGLGEINGQISASLGLEGDWDNPASQRGRGEVDVSGKRMLYIPVIGLLQITNLALPLADPFSDAGIRYSIEGQKVTLEQIELRSNSMLMQGSGTLDFASGKVRMTFVANNPGGLKLPAPLNDLVEGIRHELLQIHVDGTIKKLEKSVSSFNTFQTTVDEVRKGAEQKRR